MKALVLCGGYPQIALIEQLKKRGIKTLLADRNENVVARAYADEFYPVSVLDVDAVRRLAREQKVDFLITVCADQVLQVVAQVSEELGLPCYLDYATAVKVSKKSEMKKTFFEGGVPTSRFAVMDHYDPALLCDFVYPLIVKPVDAYSSRGVCRVNTPEELSPALENALAISRSKDAIVEEFVEGREITVDVYVEEGRAHVLCMSVLDKIGEDGKFIIHRSHVPAPVTEQEALAVADAAQKIADAFGLKNTPMLIQLILNDRGVFVLEFCARTGGGIKYLMIPKISGFDVVEAVVELTLGKKPHVSEEKRSNKHFINEFLYCRPGTFDRLCGFEACLQEGLIVDFKQFKASGTVMGEICGSGDRVAYFSVEGESREELLAKHRAVNERIAALSAEGEDLLRHDLLERFHAAQGGRA